MKNEQTFKSLTDYDIIYDSMQHEIKKNKDKITILFVKNQKIWFII